jgi:ribosomal subunit interface protein
MDHSDAIENHANAQLQKIEKLLEHMEQPVFIDLHCEANKINSHHRVSLHVKCGHYDLHTDYEHEGTDFYTVMDRVIDTMYRNIKEEKAKYEEKQRSAGRNNDEF